MLAIVLAGLLLSAWVTDWIGVHAIFGAFLFGAIMPRRGAGTLTREILGRLEQVSLSLLLPVFFVVAGLQVDAGGLGTDGLWQLGLILLVAIGGKVLGAVAGARAQRMPRRQTWALGLLMNTRGLTEIVILQVGLQLGVLDATMFTLMVIMALITTAMTGPLVRRIYPDRVLNRELAVADATEQSELGEAEAFTVLAAVPEQADAARRAVELARGLTGLEQPARVVLCRLLRSQEQLEVASGLGAELAVLAAAGDELRRLAAELSAAGTPSSVVARFSADPAADLAALAGRLNADVVLLTELHPDLAHADLAHTDAEHPDAEAAESAGTGAHLLALDAVPEALVVVAGADLPTLRAQVGVVVDGGAGGRAALRAGAQLALRAGGSIAVAPAEGRRTRPSTAAATALTRHGVRAEAVDLAIATSTGLVVLPVELPAPDGASGVLRVRAGAADVDDDLDQVVERITVGT
jgi:hypothetical protein